MSDDPPFKRTELDVTVDFGRDLIEDKTMEEEKGEKAVSKKSSTKASAKRKQRKGETKTVRQKRSSQAGGKTKSRGKGSRRRGGPIAELPYSKVNNARTLGKVAIPALCLSWLPAEIVQANDKKVQQLLHIAGKYYEDPEATISKVKLNEKQKESVASARKLLAKNKIGYWDMFGVALTQNGNFPFYIFAYPDPKAGNVVKTVPLPALKSKHFSAECHMLTMSKLPTKEAMERYREFLRPYAESQARAKTKDDAVLIKDCWPTYSAIREYKDAFIKIKRISKEGRPKTFSIMPFMVCKNLDEHLDNYFEYFNLAWNAIDKLAQEAKIRHPRPSSSSSSPPPPSSSSATATKILSSRKPAKRQKVRKAPAATAGSPRPEALPSFKKRIQQPAHAPEECVSTSNLIALSRAVKGFYLSNGLCNVRRKSFTFSTIERTKGAKIAKNTLWYLCEFVLNTEYSSLVFVPDLDITPVASTMKTPHTYCCATGEPITANDMLDCVALVRTGWAPHASNKGHNSRLREMSNILLLKASSWKRLCPVIQLLYSWKKRDSLFEAIFTHFLEHDGDELGESTQRGADEDVWTDFVRAFVTEANLKVMFENLHASHFSDMKRGDLFMYLLLYSSATDWPEGFAELLPTLYAYDVALFYYILAELRIVEHETRADLARVAEMVNKKMAQMSDDFRIDYDPAVVTNLHAQIAKEKLAKEKSKKKDGKKQKHLERWRKLKANLIQYIENAQDQLRVALTRLGLVGEREKLSIRTHGEHVVLLPANNAKQNLDLYDSDNYLQHVTKSLLEKKAVSSKFTLSDFPFDWHINDHYVGDTKRKREAVESPSNPAAKREKQTQQKKKKGKERKEEPLEVVEEAEVEEYMVVEKKDVEEKQKEEEEEGKKFVVTWSVAKDMARADWFFGSRDYTLGRDARIDAISCAGELKYTNSKPFSLFGLRDGATELLEVCDKLLHPLDGLPVGIDSEDYKCLVQSLSGGWKTARPVLTKIAAKQVHVTCTKDWNIRFCTWFLAFWQSLLSRRDSCIPSSSSSSKKADLDPYEFEELQPSSDYFNDKEFRSFVQSKVFKGDGTEKGACLFIDGHRYMRGDESETNITQFSEAEVFMIQRMNRTPFAQSQARKVVETLLGEMEKKSKDYSCKYGYLHPIENMRSANKKVPATDFENLMCLMSMSFAPVILSIFALVFPKIDMIRRTPLGE